MSNKSTLRFLVVLLFAAFASAALVLADAAALGQNANSSTTTEDSAQNDNANMTPKPRRGRRGRRGTRPAAAADANANTTMEPGTMPETSGAAGGGQTEDISGERVDLSGTYSGNLSTTGGQDVGSGPATLTITGNTFDLSTEGGAKHGGRIYAVLTRGETSAALYFSDVTDPTTNLTAVYNVRARKRGDSLRLWPAPFTKARLTFGGGGTSRPRPRRRHRARPAPAANTGDNTNTTPPR
ncbi:MAG: hypothetical protein ACJ754_13650 [Pyrinomonadaceae bacterium]